MCRWLWQLGSGNAGTQRGDGGVIAIMPLVSIGLPVFNGEAYLERAVRAILAQSFTDFELVVCDNASTDRTPEILARLAADDVRLRVHRNAENIGAAPNWNRVFTLSRGRYFKWAASDDVHEPTFLERTVAALEADPGVVLAHSRTRLVDENEHDLVFDSLSGCYRDRAGNLRVGPPPAGRASSDDPVERFTDLFLRTIRCTDIFGLIRADVLRQTPLHRSYYSSDKALLTELALRGRFHEVPEPLFMKRDHDRTSLTLSAEEQRRWIDTRAEVSRWSPKRQQYLQILGACLRVPGLGPAQRLHCAAVVLGRVDWVHFVKSRVGVHPLHA